MRESKTKMETILTSEIHDQVRLWKNLNIYIKVYAINYLSKSYSMRSWKTNLCDL